MTIHLRCYQLNTYVMDGLCNFIAVASFSIAASNASSNAASFETHPSLFLVLGLTLAIGPPENVAKRTQHPNLVDVRIVHLAGAEVAHGHGPLRNLARNVTPRMDAVSVK